MTDVTGVTGVTGATGVTGTANATGAAEEARATVDAPSEPPTLDPDDWNAFREEAHRLLDGCIERLATARDRPWRPPAGSQRASRPAPPREPSPLGELVDEWLTDIVPFATGNTHPRFFGWVHGAGLADGVLAELVAATMNSNCGGRAHAAIDIERELLGWCRELFGLPAAAGGLVTSGTSMATLLAFVAARNRVLGETTRRDGLAGAAPLVVYAAHGVHQCVAKALEVMGIGSAALTPLPLDRADGSLSLDALDAALARDRARGAVPLCVVATAGSVDTGRFDALEPLADFCARRSLWLHVDGAFGAWATLAEEPWRSLTRGIGRADSIAFDFHKWPSVPYDAGAVLVRDAALLHEAFAMRADYLASGEAGLAGGAPWPCDSGLELSRGFRALKAWSAFRLHGTRRIGASISANCAQAHRLGTLVAAEPALELAAPVTLNVCCLRASARALAARGLDPDGPEADALHRDVAARLQLAGDAVLSTTRVADRVVLRAAIVNHRTRLADIDATVAAVVAAIGAA